MDFVRLIISIELIIEKFVILMLIIVIDIAFACAIQNNFLHNNFKQYNFSNVKYIFYDKKFIF